LDAGIAEKKMADKLPERKKYFSPMSKVLYLEGLGCIFPLYNNDTVHTQVLGKLTILFFG
jgi:hypothetical protein